MCRALRLGLLGVGMLAPCGVARAQDLRALERQVDTLHAISLARQGAVARHQDSLSAEARRLDTVRVGVLVILAERPVAELAAASAQLALDSLRKSVGPALDRLAGHAFVVRNTRYRWTWEDRRPIGEDSTLDVSVLYPGGHERRAWRGRRTATDIGRAMVHHAQTVLYLDLNRDLAMWLGNQVPSDSVSTMNWLAQRLSLASAIPTVSTRCFEGDVTACKDALGLRTPQDPVTEWFDAASRRKAVQRLSRLAERLDPAATDRCLRQNLDAACISVLRIMPATGLPTATSGDARASLVRLALDRGGPNATDRLLADGTPAERIERAGGVPLDTLVADWQRRVTQARAPSRDVSAEIVLGSMMWIGVLFFASTRSSRWR